MKQSTTFLQMNSTLRDDFSQNYLTDCDTSVFKQHNFTEQWSENVTELIPSTNKFESLCNLLNNTKNHFEHSSSSYGYPLINPYSDECFCEKYQYEPFEEFDCTCRETNETCLTYDLVPFLNVTAMRYNEYYISVSISLLFKLVIC